MFRSPGSLPLPAFRQGEDPDAGSLFSPFLPLPEAGAVTGYLLAPWGSSSSHISSPRGGGGGGVAGLRLLGRCSFAHGRSLA